MEMDDQATLTGGRNIESGPSLVVELSWILSGAVRPSWRQLYPHFDAAYSGREDVAERVRAFWKDGNVDTCFGEVTVVGHHAGVLEATEPDQVWAALAAAIPTLPTDLGLESETPEVREILIDRVRQLRESPARAAEYIELLRQVWQPMNDAWQSQIPELRELARLAVSRVEDGQPLTSVADGACDVFRAHLSDITARIQAGQPLKIVPCHFFGKGLYLELPGLTLIGSSARTVASDRGARARTEALARRLKTVADPTRLALLHYLADTPSTVGSLAASFDLAQPTVSMHIKSLRESGLVRADRQDGRLQLRADPEAIDLLLESLRQAVVMTARATA
jgi:DNA-binding transcriptional ArsR family regulator